MSELPTVAAFDFDGTLSYRDTLLSYLTFVVGPIPTLGKLVMELPQFMSYSIGLMPRQAIKESILTRFLARKEAAEALKLGEDFAKEVLPRHIKPEGLQRVRWHLDRGHRCVLISANLDLYLIPWAKQNGFQDAIVSQCEVSQNGTLTGKLKGANCWGQEKTRRLTQLLGPRENYILYAYGNSRGDRELLAMADYPYYCEIPKLGTL